MQGRKKNVFTTIQKQQLKCIHNVSPIEKQN